MRAARYALLTLPLAHRRIVLEKVAADEKCAEARAEAEACAQAEDKGPLAAAPPAPAAPPAAAAKANARDPEETRAKLCAFLTKCGAGSDTLAKIDSWTVDCRAYGNFFIPDAGRPRFDSMKKVAGHFGLDVPETAGQKRSRNSGAGGAPPSTPVPMNL